MTTELNPATDAYKTRFRSEIEKTFTPTLQLMTLVQVYDKSTDMFQFDGVDMEIFRTVEDFQYELKKKIEALVKSHQLQSQYLAFTKNTNIHDMALAFVDANPFNPEAAPRS